MARVDDNDFLVQLCKSSGKLLKVRNMSDINFISALIPQTW